MVDIIVANLRRNRARVALVVSGVVLGLLTNLVTTYYFTYMTGLDEGEGFLPLPADIILNPVTAEYAHHPDVSHFEEVFVLTAHTAAGIHEILAYPRHSRFTTGYVMVEGYWPRDSWELAVPRSWVLRSDVGVGETTNVTIRFGGFSVVSQFVISGVFESPFLTYDVPVMLTEGYERTEGFAQRRVFIEVREGANVDRLAAALARQETATAETPALVARGRSVQRWQDVYGDAMAWSYTLSTMLLVVCSLGMMNVMALSVQERRSEMAVLKTFGVRSPGIFVLFFGESALVATISVAVTLLLYGLAGAALYLAGIIPYFGLQWPLIRNLCTAALVVAFVPPFYPAGLGMGYSTVRLLQR
ncbi:MAG: ABC transporter permease [Bacillota bacterium]